MNVLVVWDNVLSVGFFQSRMESDVVSVVFRGICMASFFHEQECCGIRERMSNEARLALEVYASLCAVSSLLFLLALFCGGFYLSKFLVFAVIVRTQAVLFISFFFYATAYLFVLFF